MATYSKHRCTKCGIILSQPEMVRRKINVDLAVAKRSLSNREIFGALLGSSLAQNSIASWLFSPNKTTFSSTSEVWLCKKCAKSKGWGNFLGFTAFVFASGPAIFLADPEAIKEEDVDALIMSSIFTVIYFLLILRKIIKGKIEGTPRLRNIILFCAYITSSLYAIIAIDGIPAKSISAIIIFALSFTLYRYISALKNK